MLFSLEKKQTRLLRHLGEDRRSDPHFTNAEMLMTIYRTDPAAVQQVLPHPLEPAADPYVFAFVANYPQTNFGVSYREAAVFVRARLHGQSGGYCVSMPVDDDTALIAGRERFGFPKKIAEQISLEPSGEQIIGSTVRRGTEILRIELTPTAPAELKDFATLAPEDRDDAGRPCLPLDSFLFKYAFRADGRGFDHLPRLIQQRTLFRPRPGLRQGVGRVMVRSSQWDPLAELPVIGSPVLTTWGFWDNTMLPGRVAARVWNPLGFLRYSIFRDDAVIAVLGHAEEAAQAVEGRGALPPAAPARG